MISPIALPMATRAVTTPLTRANPKATAWARMLPISLPMAMSASTAFWMKPIASPAMVESSWASVRPRLSMARNTSTITDCASSRAATTMLRIAMPICSRPLSIVLSTWKVASASLPTSSARVAAAE